MQWFNYVAESVATPLSGNAIVKSENLQEKILSLKENQPLYHCYYDLEQRESFVNYSGLMRPVFDTIHIDLDSEADLGAKAWEDTKNLCKKLQSENVSFHAYFSGNKGFHVAIHKSAIGINQGPKEEIEAAVKKLLAELKPNFDSVDLRIWNANRKFRAYNSLHEKSGLYKIRLTSMGLKLSSMPIEEIRTLAQEKQNSPYTHPLAQDIPNAWLASLVKNAEAKAPVKHSSTKEIAQGQMISDESALFSTHADKKCIASMRERALPQFNRHDIGLRMIYDLYATGTPQASALSIMQEWSDKIFGASTDRAKDMERMVHDAYHKPQTYSFGCYDDVKKAYCSAKCKLFTSLNKEKRAAPIDMTEKQRKESSEISKQTEGEIADKIIQSMGEVIKFDSDFFEWTSTHWKRLDRDFFIQQITDAAIRALDNKALSRAILSLRTQIIMKIPMAPAENNLNACSGEKFPFLDGTVHVVKDEKGKIKLELKPHKKEDYISHCKPFRFTGEHGLPSSGDFAHYVKTRSETMGEDGIVALKQLFGAALIPFAPRIFFLVGSSNTGKSTTAEILENLLGEDNVSSVNPTEDSRFAWEPAIGKIANIKRELSLKKPLKDDLLKEIRDKRPISIDRKGIKGVKATLPFLHVYCCNTLPPSHEGNTGAWDNRLTVMNFKPGYVNGFAHIDNLGAFLWSRDPGGILDFAREGLELLAKAGFKYTVTEDSREALEAWQEETDPVKAWLNAVLSGEQVAAIERKPETGALVGSSMYLCYKSWAIENNGNGYTFSDRRFFKELVRIGFVKARKTKSGNVFHYPKLEKIMGGVSQGVGTNSTRRDDSPSESFAHAPF